MAGYSCFKDKADLAGFAADVWVDFTTPTVAYENTRLLLKMVLCSSSLEQLVSTSEEIAELKAFFVNKI